MMTTRERTEAAEVLEYQHEISRRLLEEGCRRETVIDVIAVTLKLLFEKKAPMQLVDYINLAEMIVRHVEETRTVS
jgi:hypothetical protein